VKIVSLLPSATELVYTLGRGNDLVAVTDECDYPPEAGRLPVVSRCVLAGRSLTPSEIDRTVAEVERAGGSLYEIDQALLDSLRPDVILSQDLCPVCALPASQVEGALRQAGCQARVISLDPHSLEDVIDSILNLGEALGSPDRASEVAAALRRRIDAVRDGAAGLRQPGVLGLEWGDPPWGAGHWIPEMIELAGGLPLLAERGVDSRRLEWEQIAGAAPDVVVFMPCSYGLQDAIAQGRDLLVHPEFAGTPAARGGRVFATDAQAYFSRSGPRLVDGLEILAGILHPEAFPPPPPEAAAPIATRRG
jgi:iron complex transport system substrate-binding protein